MLSAAPGHLAHGTPPLHLTVGGLPERRRRMVRRWKGSSSVVKRRHRRQRNSSHYPAKAERTTERREVKPSDNIPRPSAIKILNLERCHPSQPFEHALDRPLWPQRVPAQQDVFRPVLVTNRARQQPPPSCPISKRRHRRAWAGSRHLRATSDAAASVSSASSREIALPSCSLASSRMRMSDSGGRDSMVAMVGGWGGVGERVRKRSVDNW